MKTASKKPWTLGEKMLVVTLAAVPLVLLVSALRPSRPAPAIVVPSPVLPSPNAFDTLMAAHGALIDNASCPVSEATAKHSRFTQADKEAMLTRNSHALVLLRCGLTQPFVAPPARSFLDTRFSRAASGFRGLTRLLTLESQVKAGRGDWDGAAQSGLDAVALGEKMANGSGLLGMLLGGACQSIGRKALRPTLTHLNAVASRAAAKRLEEIQTLHIPFADTLTQEKWQTQAGLLQLFRRPNWRGTLGDIVRDNTFGKGFGLNRPDQMRLFVTSDDEIMRNYTHWIDAQIADAKHAWPPSEIPKPSDPIGRVLTDFEIAASRLRETSSQTQNALVMLTLALRAYKLEHGAYPETLSRLVPDYVKAVPADPFSVSKLLLYKRTDRSYILYSIGPDGKDDGGRAIDNPGPATPARRFALMKSKGDIVAGVNP